MTQGERSLLIAGGLGLGAWLLWRQLRKAQFTFRDKVVLVTGGSRGLGLVIARRLTERGARVAIWARDEDELRRAADDLERHGARPFTATCDVTNADSVREAVLRIESEWGPVDVVINNAGTIVVGPLSTMTRGDFEHNLAVNFWGAYNAVEAVLPGMRERGRGRIVNVSSIGGKVSVPHLLPYCVSKFALVGYSHGLRAELAGDGILVTTVCPGLTRTGSPRHALFKGRHDAEYAWFSVSDSLPLLTISAERAANQILDACARGDAEIILSLPAKFAATYHALFPELSALLLSLTNHLLPGPEGGSAELREGKDTEAAWLPSWLTQLGDEAAARNNEIEPSLRHRFQLPPG
jgi:NAD(P)-dependent dehydrogenase (short-subunit alcohol dehydrogenase family)